MHTGKGGISDRTTLNGETNIRIIGLTGGIGSGKTTVAHLIEALGHPVYFSDPEASRLINQDPDLKHALTGRFGQEIYTSGGILDKTRFASLLFNDKTALADSNRIIHPAVVKDFKRWCLRQEAFLLFFESAIIFEAGLEGEFEAVICVSAGEETRIRRVMERDHTSREKVLARINNQMPEQEKCSRADFIIYNDEGDMILAQLLKIIKQLDLQSGRTDQTGNDHKDTVK